LKTLTITGNSDLTKITGDKVIAIGATAGPTVNIFNNDLEASVAQVLTTTTGAFTTNSNMGTLAAYLKLVQADVKSNAAVYFDTVQSTTDSATLETATTSTGSVTANAILITTPGSGGVTTGNNSAVKQQRAWQVGALANVSLSLTIDAVQVLHNGTGYGTVTLTGNSALDLVAVKAALATSRATTLGTTLDVKYEGNPTMPSVVFFTSVTSASNGENYTNDQVAAISAGTNSSVLTSYDVFTITVDGLSASASLTLSGSTTSATGVVASKGIASALAQAWAAKYNAAGVASGDLSLWKVDGDTTSGTITVATKASTSGSRGFGKAVSIAWAAATAAQISTATAGVATLSSAVVADWTIGATAASTDNSATGNALIVYLTEGTNKINGGVSSQATLTFAGTVSSGIELTSAAVTYGGSATATTTAANIYVTDARGDVVNGETANEGTTSATVARISTDRSQWTFTAG
jgi:hypothetical protein